MKTTFLCLYCKEFYFINVIMLGKCVCLFSKVRSKCVCVCVCFSKVKPNCVYVIFVVFKRCQSISN